MQEETTIDEGLAIVQPHLSYTLLCDDVRIEMGNKISLMGVFQNIMVEQLPVSLMKFGVLNHWMGHGSHKTEVRILSPDRSIVIVASQAAPIELGDGGTADNISFFVNVVFQAAGTYWVQTLANDHVVEEVPLLIADSREMAAMHSDGSGAVN